MKTILGAVGQVVAVATGFILAGLVAAALVAAVIMFFSFRNAKVLKPDRDEMALRADAEVLAKRMENFVKVSQDQAREAKAIARDILEGR